MVNHDRYLVSSFLMSSGPDLYGKGYSEAPKTVYDAALFVTQLALLLQFVRWNSAHIVGYSMVRVASNRDALNGN